MPIRSLPRCVLAVAGVLCLSRVLTAEPPQPPPTGSAPAAGTSLEHLPITEVTVFKDGHCFVLHEGTVQADCNGEVVLDELPAPVLGTFWPFSANPGTLLAGVVAGRRTVPTRRSALDIPELLRANPQAAVNIREIDGREYPATILEVPETRSPGPGPVADTPAPVAAPQPRPAETGSVILLRVGQETRAIGLDRIRDVSFLRPPERQVQGTEQRGVLTLRLLRADRHRQEGPCKVGLMYLQKGLRWIPNYRITLTGENEATIELQATLVNELADLKNVTAHLVVGVPQFQFANDLDPMSLQQTAARLGRQVHPGSQTALAFSNAIMSQSAVFESPPPQAEASASRLGPDVPEGSRREDLFIFAVPDITLARGQRMVIRVGEYRIRYRDVYVLDLPYRPPLELRRQFENQQQLETARLMSAPKVTHRLRITNGTKQPLTTAPALIVRGNQALGQGMMTYAPPGGTTDVDLTVAVDVRSTRSEVETERSPNALNWNGTSLARIGLAGTIALTNTRGEAIELEVVRHVAGKIDKAEQDGRVEQADAEDAWSLDALPEWYGWYSWPWWWRGANGVGRITWKTRLEAGGKVEFHYAWHYFCS